MKYRVDLTATDIREIVAAWLQQRGVKALSSNVKLEGCGSSVTATVEVEERRG